MIVRNSEGLTEKTNCPHMSGFSPRGNLILKFLNILAANKKKKSLAKNLPRQGRFPREKASSGSLRKCSLSNNRPFLSRNLSGLNSDGFSQFFGSW